MFLRVSVVRAYGFVALLCFSCFEGLGFWFRVLGLCVFLDLGCLVLGTFGFVRNVAAVDEGSLLDMIRVHV